MRRAPRTVAFRGLQHLVVFVRFVLGDAGSEYGVSHLQKLQLAIRAARNRLAGDVHATTPAKHLILAEQILRVPKSVPGDVVECGAFNGSSTAVLSLACALTGRRLWVCDSFEGLPAPREDERVDIHAESDNFYVWEQGEFSSRGGLEGVKEWVGRHGDLDVCEFVPGYFNETLKDLPAESVVLVFEDADLASSVEDCLRWLWPKLQNGCRFYSDEPWSIHVVSLFYDKEWWRRELDASPPGFFGSGRGIQLRVELGYAIKFDPDQIMSTGEKIVHLGSSGFDR